MKYFDFKVEKEEINNLKEMLNKIISIEEGRDLLKQEREDIINEIKEELPLLIRLLGSKALVRAAGIPYINNSLSYIPTYEFRYIYPAGRNQLINIIKFTPERLEEFINYLTNKLDKRNSRAGQRALLTRELRTKILERDHYRCCECGVSIEDEPHLLLEVDHIIPIAKNGLTIEENLHTLCWKCNRSKGAKIDNTSREYHNVYNAHVSRGIYDIPEPAMPNEQQYYYEDDEDLHQDVMAVLDYIDDPGSDDILIEEYYEQPNLTRAPVKLKININKNKQNNPSSLRLKINKINIDNRGVADNISSSYKIKVNLPTLG